MIQSPFPPQTTFSDERARANATKSRAKHPAILRCWTTGSNLVCSSGLNRCSAKEFHPITQLPRSIYTAEKISLLSLHNEDIPTTLSRVPFIDSQRFSIYMDVSKILFPAIFLPGFWSFRLLWFCFLSGTDALAMLHGSGFSTLQQKLKSQHCFIYLLLWFWKLQIRMYRRRVGLPREWNWLRGG